MAERSSTEVRRRWASTVGVIGVLVVVPNAVMSVVSEPSLWDWIMLVIWAYLAIYFGYTAYTTWARFRRQRKL